MTALKDQLEAQYGHRTIPSPGSSAYTRMQRENPELIDALYAERNRMRGAVKNVGAPKASTPPPPGVSQNIWNKANAGHIDGFNATSITRNAEQRDALIEAGYGDFVKAAYERHMNENAGHAIGNGADPNQAMANAQLDWYNQNYGTYTFSEPSGQFSTSDQRLNQALASPGQSVSGQQTAAQAGPGQAVAPPPQQPQQPAAPTNKTQAYQQHLGEGNYGKGWKNMSEQERILHSMTFGTNYAS